MSRFPLLLAVAAAMVAAPCLAVDGVIEINQARAVAGGVTAGDAGGFPVSINEPGSYRLTSDLESLLVGQDIVDITVENVTLDLNGFEIRGPNSCTGTPPTTDVTCTHSSTFSGDGIHTVGYATVRNGRVRGATYVNVSCSSGPGNCHIENVDVSESIQGIDSAGRAVITGCTARMHADGGIATNSGSTGSVVTGNISSFNGGEGFFLGGGDVAQGNVATDNFSTGIFSNGGTLIGNTSRNNHGDGIRINTGTVINNTSQLNDGYGLRIATSLRVGYGGNVFIDNDTGTVFGTGIQIGTNLCGTSATCP